MKTFEKYLWLSLPVLLLAAGSVFAKVQSVTECGAVLWEPGKYKLVNDLLDCEVDPVVIVGSDITLDLKGHEISCADNVSFNGVFVLGAPDAAVRNVTVKNGHVSNCADGIVLLFTEDSTVTKMSSSGNYLWNGIYGTGMTLYLSNHNVITKNQFFGNAGDGIASYVSNGNLFKHNTSTDNALAGILTWNSSGNLLKHNTLADNVSGFGILAVGETNSQFMCNRSYGNELGIGVGPRSSGNLVRGNSVTGNVLGITFYGLAEDGVLGPAIPAGNTVRSNIVEGNPFADLSEGYHDGVTGEFLLHPDGTCLNSWEKNQYGTQLGPVGCIGTSVELDDDDVCALDDDD